MKKSATFFVLFLFAQVLMAQSQRLVLLEHFTQASCGPCASVNPGLHTFLVNNSDKITSIMYHTSWPGYDPMYNHNPADAAARTSYYGVVSVPNSVLDGNYFNGHPNSWNINTVNTRYAVPSPFELSVFQSLSPTNDTLFVTMLIEATSNITGQAAAFMAIIEEHIHFTNPPGSNGERDFYNVMKKLLPTKTGISLPTPISAGDYMIIQSYWELANVYNLDQLSVIAFVQNPLSKEIHQSCNLSEGNFIAPYSNDVEIMEFTNLVSNYCQTYLNPIVRIRNNGNNPLTSLELKYQVNNEDIQTYTWNGNLGVLESALIEIPEVNYEILATNSFKLYAQSVNGTTDQYLKNDTILHTFEPALNSTREVLVKIRTDNSPEEITWEIKDGNGSVIASGGPYTLPNNVENTDVELPADGCYEFFIYDAGGNGICCGNGAGFYRLTSGGTTLASGTTFEYVQTAQFDVVSVGIDKIPVTTGFEAYPNPANSQLFIEFTTEQNRNIKAQVINQLGKIIYSTELIAIVDINQKLEINTSNWPVGIYLIMLDDGSAVSSKKISVIR
ncbi:MAG: T9SS type A sorting domain-containing protein [Lentimicrobium sp.]|nr:T9SS type A sorting domain-containing protein [Lentimicrobium sp.]